VHSSKLALAKRKYPPAISAVDFPSPILYPILPVSKRLAWDYPSPSKASQHPISTWAFHHSKAHSLYSHYRPFVPVWHLSKIKDYHQGNHGRTRTATHNAPCIVDSPGHCYITTSISAVKWGWGGKVDWRRRPLQVRFIDSMSSSSETMLKGDDNGRRWGHAGGGEL
jgi:hypothetical protein